jgi:hypothetical protein
VDFALCLLPFVFTFLEAKKSADSEQKEKQLRDGKPRSHSTPLSGLRCLTA